MDRLDLSLDDLIKAKKGDGNKRREKHDSKKSGKITNPKSRNERASKPYTAPVVQKRVEQIVEHSQAPNQPLSIFERIGTKPKIKPVVSGTSVTISNLNSNITTEDMTELCTTVGEIKEVTWEPSRKGKKTAKVLFARRTDAVTCIEKFNGMTLDETPMEVKLTGENGKENPFNPGFELPPKFQANPKNTKASLFGTALDNDDEDDDVNGTGPTFSITMRSAPVQVERLVQPFDNAERGFGRGRGGGGGAQYREGRERERGGRGDGQGGERRGGGRGGGDRGRGGSDRSSRPKKEVSEADLDKAMEAYMANR